MITLAVLEVITVCFSSWENTKKEHGWERCSSEILQDIVLAVYTTPAWSVTIKEARWQNTNGTSLRPKWPNNSTNKKKICWFKKKNKIKKNLQFFSS